MTRRDLLIGVLPLAVGRHAAAQTTSYTYGVFVGTPKGPVELIAYADRINNGQLRMSSGTFEDVPAVDHVERVLCNLPSWKPTLVWLSTQRIFRDEFAERRTLPFAVRQRNVVAIDLNLADGRDPARLQKLVTAVGGSVDNPAYLFVTMTNGSVTRDYLVEIASREQWD